MLEKNRFKRIFISSLACMLFTGHLSHAAEAPASPVKIDTVTEVSLAATADLMGTLHSRSYVNITAGVSGRLEWLQEPGEMVQQGDVLAKMDLLPLQLKQAEQKAQIKRSHINSRYFNNELKRLQKLRKTNSTSQFQLDQTKSQYELAQADSEIANLKLQQIEDELKEKVVASIIEELTENRSEAFPNNDCHQEATIFYWTQYKSRILHAALQREIITQQWLKESGNLRNAQHLFFIEQQYSPSFNHQKEEPQSNVTL